MLVAIHIQSFSAVVRKVREEERQNLGSDIISGARAWIQNNIFFCTPDPKEDSIFGDELQDRALQIREEERAIIRAHLGKREKKVQVSTPEDTAAKEYRKLVFLFVPFILFFSLGICFLCDTPLVHREFRKSVEQIMQPFSTTDPFMTRDANVKAPPVWMASHSECNPTPKSFPANQPEGIKRFIPITRVRSIAGVYDWLEQVLAGQILNAAYNLPSTTNAIPLTNPGALLLLTRVNLECQTFEKLKEVYPVRRKRTTFRNLTTDAYGGGNYRPTPERVYRVPIYFSGDDPPTTAVSNENSSGTRNRRRLSAQAETPQPTTARRLSVDSLIDITQASDTHWTAADFQEIYVGPTSVRTKMEYLRSQGFLDWQLVELQVVWMSYNGDSSMFVLNKVSVKIDEGGLNTSLKVTVVPSWHVNPVETGVRPEVVFMPLALVCLFAYLFMSYMSVQKRRLHPMNLIILDLPLALAFVCCCFFLVCMYNVAFDPGWADELSSLTVAAPGASTGHIPKFVPGPVQPWQWLPGSFSTPSRSEPCPSAESLTRFLRLQEHLEMISYYLFFCKICTGLLFIIALIRFITMVPAIPERMQGLRKLLSHLHAAKIQTACTLCTLFSSFLLFALIGYCVLGGTYNGFSSYANAVVSCVMLTQAKWNFNSVITIPQQGRSIGWLFEFFSIAVCMLFFGFMNYIVLSMIYVRYESLKAEEVTEMQTALEAKYGVVPRKRVPLMVNETVVLYFKAFVKCLSLQQWGVHLEGGQQVNTHFGSLKDEFFMSLRDLPQLTKEPRNTQASNLPFSNSFTK
ncbi:hypothetical protein, conserved [Eimeria tenella]|uniref:Polycystin cation channel PKD1/PKD2 domain-containing protein n=1 Tax=Eimeria tenella TaxID=5802 RepID=U6L3H3_EIMTE|nr:hypothetical protein, conserved [Eimeria tenella]CDJ42320.1 hypothetical protein, conserved [Eimeria tenella]|eukprot:XP_013233070.1 hypothetical protein, conserved [Eimeria tenella]